MICDKCGSELPKGWSNPTWAECVTCNPVNVRISVNVGAQPHLMSDNERYMHLKHRNECEKGRREGTKEVTEKGPLEFRPRHKQSIY